MLKFAILYSLLAIFPATLANTRQPDPGPTDDTVCTVAVVGTGLANLFKSGLNENNLVLWPKSSCCTTTDCTIQDLGCPENPAQTGSGGDICCYKESGKGADIGYCKCGIDAYPQGTCF